MKLTLTDEWLGEREIDLGDATSIIKDQLKLLQVFKKRKCSPKPQLLNRDIRSYELLLAQPDARAACQQYLDLKDVEPNAFIEKSEILKRMGIWSDA